MLFSVNCFASPDDQDNLWEGDGPRAERPDQGPGGPGGPRRGPDEGRPQGRDRGQGPRSQRGFFELTDEQVNRIMESIKKSDPAKAKELEGLRAKDPEQFQGELRRNGGDEYRKIRRERMERWLQERQADFIEWLEEYVPDEAKELSQLKESGDPNLYRMKYELVRQKYNRIADMSRRSPELAEVLVADLQLQERRDGILNKYKNAKTDKEKEQFKSQLEEVVAARYDVLIRRKQITYEWLLKRLEDLQREVNHSKEEIIKLKDDNVKKDNVTERVKDLTGESSRFPWD
jgi:hypothetical protein